MEIGPIRRGPQQPPVIDERLNTPTPSADKAPLETIDPVKSSNKTEFPTDHPRRQADAPMPADQVMISNESEDPEEAERRAKRQKLAELARRRFRRRQSTR